jgi:DNA-binding NarL/FixJ family response regulator
MLRIMLADDHHVIRLGLRHLLERKPEWKVCGEASNGRQAVEMAAILMPDVAIVDLSMPELNGLEATRQIVKSVPGTAVLIYTMNESERVVHDVLSAGAKGIVLKSDLDSSVVQAVETLAQGKPFFTSRVAETVLNVYLAQRADEDEAGAGATKYDGLTAREREVLQLLAEGKTNKEVASILGISTRTAETHRADIMRKVRLKSLSDLVRYAIRNEMIRP